MEFRTTLNAKPITRQIAHHEGAFFVGSCFSENMGKKLIENKFSVAVNPWGVLFNPLSIEKAIVSAIKQKLPAQNLFCAQNDLFFHYQYHSDLHAPSREGLQEKINLVNGQVLKTLNSSSFIFITLGTAWVFKHLKTSEIVANCHRQQSTEFQKVLLPISEILDSLRRTVQSLKEVNTRAEIIFTLSPVRHVKNGLVENSRSKSHLLTAAHQICEEDSNCHYYPSYELVIDDLRDYRFFEKDLVHPNEMATQYIWEHFAQTFLAEETKKLCMEISKINSAARHKLLNPNSEESQKFLRTQLKKISELKKREPMLNFSTEERYFKELLDS